MKQIKVGRVKLGVPGGAVLIAGPCAMESERFTLSMARRLKTMTEHLGVPFIFKCSYDKANRMSVDSFRGPRLKQGLEVLYKVKQKFGIPVLSDVHCSHDMDEAAKVLDIIQIPAFLCRQTDLVSAAAKTGKVVNIKKGQFMAPWDMLPIIKKVEAAGNRTIIITERGASFGYNNLVTDFRSLAIMRAFGYPVIYDATHSIQLPAGRGNCSAGQREFVSALSRAAIAFGCDGLFLEVHTQPDKALCDGPNMINCKELELLLKQIIRIQKAL